VWWTGGENMILKLDGEIHFIEENKLQKEHLPEEIQELIQKQEELVSRSKKQKTM
jgi:hypothetical protein